MIKFAHLLLITLAISANSTIVGGADWTDDPNVKVIMDQTHRNENTGPDSPTKDCHYIRKFTLRKDLQPGTLYENLKSGQFKHIYYHTIECLDINLGIQGEAYTTFSYDDDQLPDGTNPIMQTLPPGCPPPILTRKPTICENGVKLGKHIVSDVEEIVTKQMADNPTELNFDPNDPVLNSDEMQKVVVDLDSLERDLESILQKVYDDMANPPSPDATEELPNGVVKQVYSFPNTEVVVFKKDPEDDTVNPNHPDPGTDSTPTNPVHTNPLSSTLSDGSPADRTKGEGPERTEPGVTMLPKDPSTLPPGTFHSKRVNDVKDPKDPAVTVSQTLVEVYVTSDPRRQISKTWTRPGSDDATPWAFVEVTERLPNVKDATVISEKTWDKDGNESEPKVYDNPMRFDKPVAPAPVNVPTSLYESLGVVAAEYGSALEKVVAEKSKCLLDQIFHKKEYEIELVCATTATQADEEKVLENELVKELFCGKYKGDCSLFLDDVKAAMMAHVNSGGSAETFKIEKKTYQGELQAGAA
jgi:hypothetical protein